jgi:hypothetical protein
MLAVKFYETMPSDDENVLKGISPKIPAIVIFGETPDNTYQVMTQEQYNAYLISIEPELEAWKVIQATLPQSNEITGV